MSPDEFIDQLQTLSFDRVFNPYTERCSYFDRDQAPQLRTHALREILTRASMTELDSLWLGRELGYRGGRRTGLAFTDDLHFATHTQRWHVAIQRPTRGDWVKEQTATMIWKVLAPLESQVFLWNVFPLHSHHPGRPFTNRAHNAKERQVGTEILMDLIALLQPKRILSIGKDAALVAKQVGGSRKVYPIRHPSYGGQRDFLQQMSALLNHSNG